MSQHHSKPAIDALTDRILTDGDVEAIAEATAARVAEIVSVTPGRFTLVDARQLARDLGVSLDSVYAHATELGAMRLGSERPGEYDSCTLVMVGLEPRVMAPFGHKDLGQLVVQMRARRSVGRGSQSAMASMRAASNPGGCGGRDGA